MNLANIKNEKVLSFDWDSFSKYMKVLLEFNSINSVIPINADKWEELVNAVFEFMSKKPKWTPGSHSPGADIWLDDFSISVKSGNISNDNLIISSYRLTRFNNLNEMSKFIDGEGKNFDIYLCCARTDNRHERLYQIFLIDSHIIKAKNMKWSESYLKKDEKFHSGWVGHDKNDIYLNIVKKMSNQLWIHLPLRFCNKILEVRIKKDKLGRAVTMPLKKSFL